MSLSLCDAMLLTKLPKFMGFDVVFQAQIQKFPQTNFRRGDNLSNIEDTFCGYTAAFQKNRCEKYI